MRMLTDNSIHSIKQDKFGFDKYASLLASTIIDTDELPFTMGIFGEWGTGKTSLMKLIEEELKDKNTKYNTIWFNPWKYDQKEELWNAMIQTILYKIAEDPSAEIADGAKRLASHMAWFAFKKGINYLTSGVIKEKTMDRMKDVFTKQDELHYRHINKFEEDFSKVIDLYTSDGKVVIFIDDLDRCIPENAITVLESLKLFIGNAKCVFVLGMDHFIVEEGIRHRYGDKVKISGRDYLNKIIQVPFYLPPITFQSLKRAVDVTKSTDYTDSTWKLLEYGLGGNPRQTKRFVNCFYLLNEVLKRPSDYIDSYQILNEQIGGVTREDQQYYLAKLLILQLKHTDFYSYLSLYPDAWKLFDESLLHTSGETLKRNRIFMDREELQSFWDDKNLRLFMQRTHPSKNFPPTPEPELVLPFLKMTSLVASTEDTIKMGENINVKQSKRPAGNWGKYNK